MSNNFKPVQAQAFTLSGAGVVAGATSLILKTFTGIDGATLAMTDFGAIGFGTLEPGNGTLEEQISFTGVTQNANGTATLTGVSNVLFVSPYTKTSGVAKTHAGSTSFVLSNTSGFYDSFPAKADDATITGAWVFPTGASNPQIGTSYVAPTGDTMIPTKKYVDDVAIAGAPDAGTTTKGILKHSVAAVSATGPIGVGDNDTRVPPVNTSTLTTGQVAALVGTVGTASSGNKYATADALAALLPSGSVQMYAGASAPSGWLLCDGSAVSRATYATLFGIISTTYGAGDASTTFNVPDMRGRTPIGVGTGSGGATAGTGLPSGGSTLTTIARATWKGEETHQLSIAELAAHTHTVPIATTGGGSIAVNTAGGVANESSGSTGSDTPHNNIQPVMGINFLIKT